MTVYGKPIDTETRCVHYDSPRDIVAIKFKCCGQYFPCHRCHDETVPHRTERWSHEEFAERAVLCGRCGTELTIRVYLNCEDRCPNCGAAFNPGCRTHRHLYFEV